MATQTSEIEKIIKNDIAEETARSIADIEKNIEDRTQAAIDRINGVYTSALKTLEQLELTDATVFDFFQKTQGNIRVFEFENKSWGRLDLSTRTWGNINEYNNPINLKEKTKYKIIVMAMEIKDIEKTKED